MRLLAGGSTLVIGPRGEIRYVISKSICNLTYQSELGMWTLDSNRQLRLAGPALALTHARRTAS